MRNSFLHIDINLFGWHRYEKMLTTEWNSVSTETIITHNDYYCDIECNKIISEAFQILRFFLDRLDKFEVEYRRVSISNVAKLPPWWMVAPFITKQENGSGNEQKMSIILNPSAINNVQRKSHSRSSQCIIPYRSAKKGGHRLHGTARIHKLHYLPLLQ